MGTVQTDGASGLFIGGTSFLNSGLIDSSPSIPFFGLGSVAIVSDELNNLASGEIKTNGGSLSFGDLVVQTAVTNAGSISADGGGIIFASGTVDNFANGLIEISAGTITVAAPVILVNDGTIASDGGSIAIA